MNSDNELIKRFEELHQRAILRSVPTNSHFLSLAEQALLLGRGLFPTPRLFGGYDESERKIALFGYRQEWDAWDIPVMCVKVSPLQQKFADTLTHRDFLGAIMNLGIKRELLGDIPVIENEGYVFCLDKVADIICSELKRIKHTSVKCEICGEIPSDALPKPVNQTLTASSERLDLIIAEVWNLSRAEAKQEVLAEKVFVNSKVVTDPSAPLKPDSVVSLRGKGRFIYRGSCGVSKKGKLKITVGLYK